MEYKDYYKILGLKKGADDQEIKKAYRKLARQYHPDMNPGDKAAEAKFKDINEANEVLSDPEKRQMYDRFGSQWKQYQQAQGGPAGGQNISPEDLERMFGRGFGSGSGGGSGFSSFFDALFGNGGGFSGFSSAAAAPIEQELEITLEEAFQGTSRVMSRQDGSTFEAKIPAGVKTGSKIKLKNALSGRDVVLIIKVKPHAQFEREGDDLKVKVPVDLYTALLGGLSEVSSLDRKGQITIPAGAQNGQTIRLRGMGMPKVGKKEERGDLYAKLEVQLPQNLTAEEKELFEKLRSLRAG
jgi:curved DNA-binding protein